MLCGCGIKAFDLFICKQQQNKTKGWRCMLLLFLYSLTEQYSITVGYPYPLNYIGHPNGSCSLSAKAYDERYAVIRNAQAALCGNSDNFILAGSFEGYINDMIDQYHYNQHAYNEVGKSVGKSMAEWVSKK